MFFFFMTPDGDVEQSRRSLEARAATVLSQLEDRDLAVKSSLAEVLPLEAAIACGYCLLSGARQPTPGFPRWLAPPAAACLRLKLETFIADADRLPSAWDAATPAEAEELVVGLLRSRMDAWAALEMLRTVADVPGLRETLESCEKAVAALDLSLADRMDFLATVAETHLLADWRRLLAPAYRSPFPWWLDGHLEAEAVQTQISVDTARERLSRLPIDAPSRPAPQLSAGGDVIPIQFADFRVPANEDRVSVAFCLVTTHETDQAPGWSRKHPLQSEIRWLSRDGLLTARLVPGASEQQPPMVEFSAARVPAPMGKSLDILRGCVAVLWGVGSPIEWRSTGGREIAAAVFPTDAPRVWIDLIGSDAGSLFTLPHGGAWRMVEAEG